ncbi:MAG: glycosyltransferase family 2 protein [Candidatus Peribacteraceae bacterium]|jgi:GT2 family glycosyltransferase|nr:glycosyltransferase family 2 protein [Candidatus Peribacteraceae bacterium]HCI04218.1 hypothetical protein [Candidatus Peribacteria bacterium]|tara:strand:- start:8203 stop:9873 length:1671 start_codon:yes stop_codon:yes gene_type:complete
MHDLPYAIIAFLNKIWTSLGRPFARPVRFIRHRILGHFWPAVKLPNTITPIEFKSHPIHFKPLISLILHIHKLNDIDLHKCLASVTEQTYDKWEIIIKCDDPSIEIILEPYVKRYPNKIKMGGAKGDYFGFIDASDTLENNALEVAVQEMQSDPRPDILYSDHSLHGNPILKPDWSPELLLSYNYIQGFLLISRDLKEQSGDYSCIYDLLLRATEKTELITHISQVLCHKHEETADQELEVEALEQTLKRRSLPHTIRIPKSAEKFKKSFYKIDYNFPREPSVTIIIPTKDRPDLLRRCLKGIRKNTNYNNFNVLVADNGSTKKKTLKYLQSIPEQVVRIEQEKFNFSDINNQAVKLASGEYVLFMNDDVFPINSNWLKEMVGVFSLDEKIGVVGAKLLYKKNKFGNAVQHSGMVLGRHYASLIQFTKANELGYNSYNQVLRNCSAISGACMLTKKSLFAELDGFDEKNLAIDYSDVDYCLKALEKGYRIVVNSHALLIHDESATRGDNQGQGAILNQAEADFLVAKWKNLIRHDPHYHPRFSLDLKDNAYTVINA